MYYGKKVTTDFKPEKTEKKTAIKKKQIKCNCCGEFFDQKIIGVKYCMAKDECVKAWREVNKVKIEKAEKKKRDIEKKVWHMTNDKLSVFEKRLEHEINAIARLIDFGCNCISCKPDTPIKKIFAGHFHSVGSNNSLRFNLHNLHVQCFSCNGNKGGAPTQYKQGLKRIYGDKYADYIETTMVAQYPVMKWTREQLCEWIVIAKKLRKDLANLPLKHNAERRIIERTEINNLIGIYTNTF